MNRASLFFLGTVLALPSLASGDATDTRTPWDAYFLEEIPVVLSATRLAQTQKDAPAAITIIDKDMIKASGAKEIVELFRLVPGMQLGYVNAYTPIVTYHGMASPFPKHLQVLIDGASFYNPASGGVPWVDLPLLIEDIERIEVIRGPNAASYGPNSMLGVINIITTHAAQDQGLMLKGSAGNRDYERLVARAGGTVGDFDFRLSLGHVKSSGLRRVHDDYRTDLVNGRFDYRATASDLIQWNFGYSQGPRQTEGDNIVNLAPRRTAHDNHFYQHLRWEHYGDNDNSIAAQFTYTYNNMEDDYPLSLFGQGFFVDDSRRTERFDFEIQHTLSPTDTTRLVWGIGMRRDEIDLPFATNTQSGFHSTLHRVFGNLEWRALDPLTVNLGALFEHNSALAHNDFSPRLALNYHLSDDHGVRFIASRDSRSPTLAEVHLDTRLSNNLFSNQLIRADDTLLHEKAHYFELGYFGQFFARKLTADFKIFRQEFQRLIGIRRISPAADADGRVFVLGNTAKARSEGYELQIDFRPMRKSLLRVGYSHIQISTDKPNEGFNVSAPDDSFSILASHTFSGGWRLGSAFYYRSDMEFLGLSDPLGSYKRLDIMAGKTFKLGGKDRFSLAFTQQFALDKNEDYTEESVFDNRSYLELIYTHD